MRDHWPFQYRPELFERANAVFEHYGILAVFIGYFIGPLRGPIPVAAGIAGMPYVQFHIASVVAAVIWTLTVIAPGAILHQSFGPNNPILLLASLIVPVVIIWNCGGYPNVATCAKQIQPTAPQAVVPSPGEIQASPDIGRTIKMITQPDSEKPQRDHMRSAKT